MPDLPDRPSEHRQRLMQAMATAVAQKGLGAVTIADLAAEAHVSKRSFYEQFRDKNDCFTALYEDSSLRALAVLQQAFDPARAGPQQLEPVLAAYFGALAAQPTLLSTLFIDIMAIGPAGLAARRRTIERLARCIIDACGGRLGEDQAVALVGGLHEWVLQALEQGETTRLSCFAPRGAHLVRAVLAGANDGAPTLAAGA